MHLSRHRPFHPPPPNMDPRLGLCVFCRQAIRNAAVRRQPLASNVTSKQWHRTLAASASPSRAPRLNCIPRPGRRNSCTFQKSGLQPVQVSFSSPTQRKSVSTTALLRQAAVQNPRQDEDGNEMVVEITPRAADRLKQIMTTDANPNLALRISVESGGCHGFQYLMSLTNMSKVSADEDTVFEALDGAKIVLDEPSLELLKGSKVDYTMELIGSQFKIVDNPHATSSCGCGTSFDIKM